MKTGWVIVIAVIAEVFMIGVEVMGFKIIIVVDVVMVAVVEVMEVAVVVVFNKEEAIIITGSNMVEMGARIIIINNSHGKREIRSSHRKMSKYFDK